MSRASQTTHARYSLPAATALTSPAGTPQEPVQPASYPSKSVIAPRWGETLCVNNYDSWSDLPICVCGMRHWPEETALRHTLSSIQIEGSKNLLWLSGDADPSRELEHTKEVYSTGVRTILDVRDASSSISQWSPLHEISVTKVETKDSYHDFENPSKLVKHLENLAGTPLLIHCHMGVNRSASVAILMLVLLGETPGRATELVLASRDSALGIYAPMALKNWLGSSAGNESMEAIESIRGRDRRLVDLLKRRDRATFRL